MLKEECGERFVGGFLAIETLRNGGDFEGEEKERVSIFVANVTCILIMLGLCG